MNRAFRKEVSPSCKRRGVNGPAMSLQERMEMPTAAEEMAGGTGAGVRAGARETLATAMSPVISDNTRTHAAWARAVRHPLAAREDWGVADLAAAGSTAAAGAERRARCRVSYQKPQRKNR